MKRRFMIACAAMLAITMWLTGCEDEGPMESAGKRLDRAADRVRYGDETSIEKAERKVKAAIEELEREYEQALEDARE
jgi:hyperosmotically inducible protein